MAKKRARSMTREEFVARYPHLYLVISENPEKLAIGFETAVVSTFSGKPMEPGLQPAVRRSRCTRSPRRPAIPIPTRISVGRARNCDLVMRDLSVSKLHGHFRLREAEKLDLIDLDSQNGTAVNGRPLLAHAPEWVAPGDTLRFGTVTAKLVDSDALFDLLQE